MTLRDTAGSPDLLTKKKDTASLPPNPVLSFTGTNVYDTQQAKELGYEVPEGWGVKESNGKVSLISPDKWEFSDLVRDDEGNISDYLAIDTQGNKYTKAELELWQANTNENGELDFSDIKTGIPAYETYRARYYQSKGWTDYGRTAGETSPDYPLFVESLSRQYGSRTPEILDEVKEHELEAEEAYKEDIGMQNFAASGASQVIGLVLPATSKLINPEKPEIKAEDILWDISMVATAGMGGVTGVARTAFGALASATGASAVIKPTVENWDKMTTGEKALNIGMGGLMLTGLGVELRSLATNKTFWNQVVSAEAKQKAGQALSKVEQQVLDKAKLIENEVKKTLTEIKTNPERGSVRLPQRTYASDQWAEQYRRIQTPGEPEAGLQSDIFGGAKEVHLVGKSQVVQESMDDFLKLRQTLETKTKLTVKEQRILDAINQADAKINEYAAKANTVDELSSWIKGDIEELQTELMARSSPFHGGVKSLFKGEATEALEAQLKTLREFDNTIPALGEITPKVSEVVKTEATASEVKPTNLQKTYTLEDIEKLIDDKVDAIDPNMSVFDMDKYPEIKKLTDLRESIWGNEIKELKNTIRRKVKLDEIVDKEFLDLLLENDLRITPMTNASRFTEIMSPANAKQIKANLARSIAERWSQRKGVAWEQAVELQPTKGVLEKGWVNKADEIYNAVLDSFSKVESKTYSLENLSKPIPPAATIKPEVNIPKAEAQVNIKQEVESLLSEGKPVPKDMMDEYIKLAKTPKTTIEATSEVPSKDISGTVPPKEPPASATPPPPVPPDSSLGTIEGMWNKGRQPVKKSTDAYLKAQEYGNDIYYGIRRMQGQIAKNIPIEAGGKNDVITLLTRSPGAANAGATRYILAIEEIKKIAPNAMADDINTILYANHAKEVLAEKGAGRVMAGGFTTQSELDAALYQLEKKLGRAEFDKVMAAAEHIKGVYANELKRLVAEGLVSKELGEELAKKYPWYNPLQYVEDAEILAGQGKSVKPFNVITSGLKKLTQEGTAAEASAPLNILGDQLIKNEVRIVKNQVSKSIVELALKDKALGVKKIGTVKPVANVNGETIFRQTYEDIPGTLSFFEDGVRQVYQVPDFIYREANVLTKTISNPVSSLIGSLNGISRAAFTTASPPFVVSNMLNDMLTAFINRGIMPHETGMRLIKAIGGLKNDKIMQAFRLAGGYQQRFYGRGANALAKDVGVASGKVITDSKSFMKKVWEAIPSAGEAGEQAPRTALFKRQLDRTLPDWRKMTVEEIAATPQGRKAAADAVELTINFGRGGYLIKAGNPFVIFLNASMEGAKLPFRVLRDNPAARWRLAGVGAGAAGIAAYNLSYPEYMDIPNNIRWGSFVIMLPSTKKNPDGTNIPNYITIIPKTREWGMFLGSLTYAMETLYGEDPASFGKFSATMAPTLSPVSSIPIPEVIAEIVEQGANWDFYTSRPVVSQSLQNLPAEEQTTPNVSRTIEAGAKALGVSPVRAQHFINGLFGGTAQTITSVTDWIAKLVSPETPSPEIVALSEQYNALPEDKQEAFMNKLSASNKRALTNYLTGRREALPVLGAIAKRIMPGYGGQLESNLYDLKEKVSVLPSYWTDSMTPEQMKKADVKLWTQKKKDDSNIIQKYAIDTMDMDDYNREIYLEANPETEATLLLWNRKSSVTSIKAAKLLKDMATEYGIPLELIPAFGKNDSGKERLPPEALWADYFAYYDLDKLETDKTSDNYGRMVADTKKRSAFRYSHSELEDWMIENGYWKKSESTSSPGGIRARSG